MAKFKNPCSHKDSPWYNEEKERWYDNASFEVNDSVKERKKTWDSFTNERISKIYPDIQQSAINFINQVESELGIRLRVYSGKRTWDEQDALYEQGRTLPGKIITNAKGGYSYHNYGLAIDVVEIRNKEAIWDTNWLGIGKIGIENGFEWGGNFESFIDKPHFQMTLGYSISDLLKLHKAGKWY